MKDRNLLTPDNSVICLNLNSPRVKNASMLNSPSRFRFRKRAIVNAGTDDPSTTNDGGRRGMGSSDEKCPPSPRQTERPKARLAARPSFAVVLGRRRDVICRDLDLCVFGRSLLAPAPTPIRSGRRRQVRSRSLKPLARGPPGHPRGYRARAAGCLRVKDFRIGVPKYWRHWSSGIGKSRRTRRITTQTKLGGLPSDLRGLET